VSAGPGGRGRLADLSDELALLVERTVTSVVALSGRGADFSASGSGFVIDDEGHAVTNAHVVEGFTGPIDTVLHGSERQRATVIGADPVCDLALLRLERPPGHHLALREEPARLGELCFGLGSPLGLYPESIALGVVSGVARTVPQQRGRRPIFKAIQTDVAINPGNSGGPLLDAAGEVLGVNQCIDTRASGIGFAIPAATVRSVVGELKTFGSVERAALGVTVVRRTAETGGQPVAGLAVTRVADTAGARSLAVGDVIVGVDGHRVSDTGDLYAVLTRDLVDRPTDVEVVRDGTRRTVSVRPTRLRH
jgi:S1-C subfamily serine protease